MSLSRASSFDRRGLPRLLAPGALCLALLAAASAQAQATDVPAGIKSLDELYPRRDDPQAIKDIEAMAAELLKAAPEDPEVLWRVSRWNFWKADTAASSEQKEQLSKLGWDQAEKALTKAPESKDARYWAAANCGDYSDGMGIVTALSKGLEGKFRKNLDWMVEKAPSYDNWGPLLSFGRYYAKLPWPKRDRKKAAELYKQVLTKQPTHLRARLFWAEMRMDDGGKENYQEALKLVNEILAATPTAYDPPEERFIQKLAKNLKPKIEEELK